VLCEEVEWRGRGLGRATPLTAAKRHVHEADGGGLIFSLPLSVCANLGCEGREEEMERSKVFFFNGGNMRNEGESERDWSSREMKKKK
jgi:hypothetical protein